MPDQAQQTKYTPPHCANKRPTGLKRCYSLKRNKEFRYLYKNGRSVALRACVLVYKKQSRGQALPRIGFSVSKKLGKSVVRNRVKRRMRAALTPLLPNIKSGCRLIFIARTPILDESFEGINRTFLKLLEKAELINIAAPADDAAHRTQ